LLDQLKYKQFGSRAILIEWPAKIDEKILKDILQFKNQITSNKKGLIEECIIAYHSLTIVYLKEIIDFSFEKKCLSSLYLEERSTSETTSFLWKIPVCYDMEFGIDLEEMSSTLNLSISEIVDLHAQTIYTVYFIGFLPGFLYLGGLDRRLEIKRKPNPRLYVAKGSVAIGGSQTGIYPMDSAGGWNIIGKTPLTFFNLNSDNPCFAKPGDKIQFVPISRDEFRKLEIKTKLELYEPSKIKLNG
tara:strand:- start:534 stop:1265 length:732 start_codon:yes stop_codon:yes gene_type:complete